MFLKSVTPATLSRFSRSVLFCARHSLLNFVLSERQVLFKEKYGVHTIVKPHTNGCNVVGQQLSTLLDVTCCVRLHTLLPVAELLHIVGSCCIRFSRYCQHGGNDSQNCWSNNVGSCCVRLYVAKRGYSDNASYQNCVLYLMAEVLTLLLP